MWHEVRMIDRTSNSEIGNLNGRHTATPILPARSMRTYPRLHLIGALLGAAALLLGFPAPAHALEEAVLVSNTGQSTASGDGIGNTQWEYALAFTTGSNSNSSNTDFKLGSIVLQAAQAPTSPAPTVKILEDNSNLPGMVKHTLTVVTGQPNATGPWTFTADDGDTLEEETKYWLFIYHGVIQDPNNKVAKWEATVSDDEDSDGAPGWSIANRPYYNYVGNTTATWLVTNSSNVFKVRINERNTAPTGADKTVSTDEDTPYTFAAGDFGFADDNANSGTNVGSALHHVKITSLPGAGTGTLQLDGTPISSASPPKQVTKDNLDDDMLTYHPPANDNGNAFTTFDFKVNDSQDDSADDYTVTINVTAVNDVPVATDDAAETTEEMAVDIDVIANDSDVETPQADLRVTAVGTPDNGGNAVIKQGSTTTITYTPPDDFIGTDTFSYTVSDGATPPGTDTGDVTVTVLLGVYGETPIAYAENGTEAVGTYTASRDVTWSLSGDDSGDFQISTGDTSDTGVLTFTQSPNFEDPTDANTDNEYLVTLVGSDGTHEGTLDVTVTVTGVNEFAPLVTGPTAINYAENGIEPVATYTITDADAGDSFSVSVGGAAEHDSGFVYDNNINKKESIDLKFFTSPDFESPADKNKDNVYLTSVLAYDGSRVGYLEVTVTVTDAPAVSGFTEIEYVENGTETVATYSVAPGTTVTWSLEQTDDYDDFSIDSGGALTFSSAPNFELPTDGDPDNIYKLTVQATEGTEIGRRDVTVTVTNTNDTPDPGDPIDVTIDEDGAVTISVLEDASDDDPNATLTVTEVPEEPTNGSAEITDDRTTVTYTPDDNFNGTDTFTYTVSDGTDTAIGTVNVTVNAVNDVPTADNPVQVASTDEDTAHIFAADDFGFVDVDDDTLDHVSITGLPGLNQGQGKLSLDDTDVVDDAVPQKVTKAELDSGEFKYTPPANANGAEFATFKFKLHDGTDYSVAEYTFSIDVTAVNDPPTSAGKTVYTNQYTEYPFAVDDFGFTDIDSTELDHVKITALPTTGTGTLFLDDAQITSVAPPPQVAPADLTAGKLKYRPPAGEPSGDLYATFTFKVNDGTDDSASDYTLTVHVDKVDQPVVSGPTTLDYEEGGTAAVGTYQATGPEGASLVWGLGDAADADDFSISAAGVLSFKEVPDYGSPADANGDNVYEVTVTAQALINGLPVTGTLGVTVTVTAKNQAPTLSGPTEISYAENGTQAVGAFTVTNKPAADITWALDDADDAGADADDFSISGGVLSFASPPDFETPADDGQNNVYEVTVKASDSTDTDTLDVTVTVTDVNEPPTSDHQKVSTNEDTNYPFTASDFAFVDVDANGALDHVKITSLPGMDKGILWLDVDGNDADVDGDGDNDDVIASDELADLKVLTADIDKLTYTPPANAYGDPFTTFTFKVNDGAADSTESYTITIKVTAVNDPPTAADNTVSTNQYTDYSFAADDFGFTDVDSAELNRVTITPLTGEGTLSLDDNAIASETQVTKAQLDAGDLKYRPPADPTGSIEVTFDFKVNDGDADSGEYTMTVDMKYVHTPVVSGPATVDYLEGSTHDVATYTATTEESVNLTLRLQETGDYDDFTFDVNQTTGHLKFKTAPDFVDGTDNEYHVTVEATVTVGGIPVTGTLEVTVAVTEANETLAVSGPTAISYGENGTDAVAAFTASKTVTWGLSGEDNGDFEISDTGVLAFTESPDFELPADADQNNQYQVTVTATAGDQSATLAVTVTVTDADDPPVWTGATAFSVQEGSAESFTFTLTDQDTKPNGDRQDISVYLSAEGTHSADREEFRMAPDDGIVATNEEDVTLSFAASPDYEQPTDANGDNVYVLTLVAYNPGISGPRVEHPVTVIVTNVDDDPVATDDSATTDEDTAIVITVLVNDLVDAEATPLSIESVAAAPTNGSAVVDTAENTITYTPKHNFHGNDTFSYTITDSADPARTASAEVEVKVNPVNDAPLVGDDTAQTSQNTPVVIDVGDLLLNDSDVEGNSLGVTAVGTPDFALNGSAVLDLVANTITYTPRPNYYGSDRFSYTVSDGSNTTTATAPGTVTVMIGRDGTDATLSALTISQGTLSPTFRADETSYTVDVAASVTQVQVTPTTPNDANSTVTVNGTAVVSGANSGNIALTEGGATTIAVEVTAEDGRTTNTYTITVFRSPDSDDGPALYFEEQIGDSFRWISTPLDGSYCLDASDCDPGKAYQRFTATAVSDVVRIRRPSESASDAYYSIETISSQDVSDGITTHKESTDTAETAATTGTAFGAHSEEITLAADGLTNIWVTVEDTHTVTALTRSCYDPAAALTNMVVQAGADPPVAVTLNPAFASGVTDYTAAVEYAVTSVTVTPTFNPDCSTVTVGGTEVASGVASGASALWDGEVISIPVVFKNGSNETTYTIKLLRPVEILPGGSSSLQEDQSSFEEGVAHRFHVTLSAVIGEDVTVDWSVSSGTGRNPATADDFPNGEFPKGSVTFTAGGALTELITFQHRDDGVVEDDETFMLTLTAPAGGFPLAADTNFPWVTLKSGATTLEGTIVDDDGNREGLVFPDDVSPQVYQNKQVIKRLVLPAATRGIGAVSYTLTPELPAGLKLEVATRTISGTPQVVQERTGYAWTATDAAGATASAWFSITVGPYLGPTVIEELPPLSLVVGGESARVDAAPAMAGDDLSWTFASSDAGVAAVQGAGSVVEVAPVHEGTAQVTATATNQHGTASVAFTVTVRTSAAEAEAIRAALAGHARVVLGSVTEVIGQRVDGGTGGRGSGCAPTDDAGNDETWNADPRGGSGTYASGFDGSLGDPSGAGGVETGGIRHVGNSGRGGGMIGGLDDALSLIWGRSFSLALGGDQATDCAGMGGNASRWNVWGAADLQQASGGTEVSDYEGEWRLLYFGADRAFDEQLMGGMAVSRVWGEADYRFEDHTASGAGHLSSTLTGIYPYVYGSFWGLQLWAIGGLGSGDVTNVREHVPGPPDEGNLVMGLAVAGLSKSLYELGGVQLSLIGDVGYLSLSADGGGSLAGAQASVGRVRLGLEMAGRLAFGLEPFVQVRGRYDGGDGPTGTAAEMVGGLRYTAERLNLEVRGNYLVSTADFQQWGANARVGYRPAADGGGLSGSLATQWGAPDSGGSFQDGHTMQMPGADLGSAGQSPPLNLSGEIGYGLSIPRLRGSLTPTVGYDYRGQGDSRASVGVAYVQSGNLAGDVRLRLDIARTERREAAPDHSIELSAELRY